jgi:hypothetical protein
MKKVFIALGILGLFTIVSINAQTVNDIPIKDIDVKYIEIVGNPVAFSTKLEIQIDFGQRNKLFNNKDTHVKDANGDIIKFNSMIDALNFMSENGYEFVNAYVVTNTSQGSTTYNIYHYVLKRSKEN